MGKKPLFYKGKKKETTLEKTQEAPDNCHCYQRRKQIDPTDILGISNTGKAMEPWCEGWFFTHRLQMVERKKCCSGTRI